MNNWKKKFIIIWSGQLFSILSSSIAQFSIVLWISLKTGSAEVLSFAMIACLVAASLVRGICRRIRGSLEPEMDYDRCR